MNVSNNDHDYLVSIHLDLQLNQSSVLGWRKRVLTEAARRGSVPLHARPSQEQQVSAPRL